MSNSDITDRADWMNNGRARERQQMPQHLREGCLECVADVLSKVLDLSRPVPVPEELVQAAIRVFPAAPPPVKPSSAPALPLLAPRLPDVIERAQPEPLTTNADSDDGSLETRAQSEADSAQAVVVSAGASSKG
jgi:hypothetical protein